MNEEYREDKVSIRGRTARRMVRLANHFPVLGAKAQRGELRQELNKREKPWVCPEHLQVQVIHLERFSMELLTGKEQTGDSENEETCEDVSQGGALEGGGILPKTRGALVLQLHGGGYYGGFHNTYRKMAALYHEVTEGLDVLSIDYRVAPEHPFPAALEDAVDAYNWALLQGYKNIFVVGDSAGGGLALALGLYLRDHGMPMPKGIVTMSAWTDLTKSGESYHENFNTDPIFGGSKDSLVYKEGYYGNNNPGHPYISPINGDFSGFPPMLMQVGEYEMLLSDTLEVARKAQEAGVTVKEHTYAGMFHVFQMGQLLYPEAKQAWIEVGYFIRRLLRKL